MQHSILNKGCKFLTLPQSIFLLNTPGISNNVMTDLMINLHKIVDSTDSMLTMIESLSMIYFMKALFYLVGIINNNIQISLNLLSNWGEGYYY